MAGVWRTYVRALGPGLVTGASDDDPSGVATYAQAGAQFRYDLVWTALITFPLMFAVQEICDRTALATGRSLGRLAHDRFARTGRIVVALLLVVLLAANTLNVAADLLAIGAGAHLLHAGSQTVWAVVAGAAITLLVVTGSFETIARVFKYLCFSLLAYIVVLAFMHVDWVDVIFHALVPHIEFNRTYIALLIAILGTTISPYLFFWQSAHRIEELRSEPEGGERAVSLEERPTADAQLKVRTSRLDVATGMLFSNVVMFAIIVATGTTLGNGGGAKIDSAAQAAAALEPVAGGVAKTLFAIGFISTGFLAVPVLAGSAAAAITALRGSDWGFSRSARDAPLFYTLVAAGTLGGAILSLAGVNPITLLVAVALINGLTAVPFLVLVMVIAGDRRLMGSYTNGRLASVLGWSTAALMAVAALALFIVTL
jgi:NRAMP (natural resistance-associated macrophage protein)-like metal ion transporter